VPAEIKLSDGTSLISPKSAGEVKQEIQGHDRLVRLETDQGEFWINPAQVAFIRDVPESEKGRIVGVYQVP
jgi:hypothetical protein